MDAVGTVPPGGDGRRGPRERPVLVVDDSAGIRELFRVILESALPERQIEVAQDGAEAVRSFEERRHAVLLMDLNMPVMDGEEAFLKIRELCADRDWPMPCIVFVTGYAPPSEVQTLVKTDGGHCILPKPVTEDTLIDTIKRCLKP